MSLNELWFILVALLFVGFFFLEGFDFGVGLSTKFLARTETERRLLINSIGPFWDANEVWLVTAAGAMFAAFPHWYATLFSGFYIPFVIVLLALIGRGVAFEYRGKVDSVKWRTMWDRAIFLGSMLPPFLLGVVLASLIQGMPIDRNMQMHAGLFDVVNVYTVVGGVTLVVLCLLHGLSFVSLKLEGDLQGRARKMAKRLLVPLAALLVAFGTMTYAVTDVFEVRGGVLMVIAVLGVLAFVLAGAFMNNERDGWAFAMTGTVIAFAVSSIFAGLFPRVMVSSLDRAFHLTVYNAASGPYALKVMSIIALTLLPFVLAYQIWSYYVFRKRLNEREHLEY